MAERMAVSMGAWLGGWMVVKREKSSAYCTVGRTAVWKGD